MVIICKYCNKIYSSYSSRCNHIKKFHSECVIPIVTHVIPNVTENVTHVIPNVTENVNNKTITCKNCNKQFYNRQSKWRHEKICQDKKYKNLEEKNEFLEKEILGLKAIIQKALKIHP